LKLSALVFGIQCLCLLPHSATPPATHRPPPTLALNFSVCNIKWVKRGNVSSLSTFAKKAYACYLIGFGLSYKITANIAHNNNKVVVKLLPFMWPVQTRVCNEMIAMPRIQNLNLWQLRLSQPYSPIDFLAMKPVRNPAKSASTLHIVISHGSRRTYL